MVSTQRESNWSAGGAPDARRERLVLLPGIAWGIGAAWWIVGEQWIALIFWLILPPLFLLLARAPFAAILLWILFAPIFALAYGDDTRWLNWLFSRLLFPTALALGMLSFARHRAKRPVALAPAEGASVIFIAGVASLIVLTDPNSIRYLISLYDLLFVPICAYWLLRLYPPSERNWRQLAIVCAVALAVQLIVGCMAWTTPELLPFEWTGLYGERTVGTLGRPAVFTGALTFSAIIIFFVTSASGKRWVRAPGVLTLMLALVGILWSFSRGSWLASVPVAAGIIWIYARTLRRAIITGIAIVGLVAGGLLIQNAEWAFTRLTDYKRAEERLIDEITSIRMIAIHPVFGWGYLRHNESRAEFVRPLFTGRVVPELVSHNTYLTLIADLGIPLFILYMTPALWWLWRTWQLRHTLAPDRFRLVVLLWLVLVHMFIVSFFSDVASWHPVGTIQWWLTLGLIAGILSLPGLPVHATSSQEASS